MSTESTTLFVQGVPEGVTQAQFQTAVTGAAKEASKVNLNERKRFAHVVFESHEAAEKGLKALKKAHIGGQTLDFEWSVAKESNNKAEFDEANNKTVVVRGLATSTDAEEVKTAFEECGETERCFLVNDKKTKSSRGHAIVEYKNRSSAEKALELNETELGGQTITVEFAKAPRPNQKKSQTNGGSAKNPAQKRKASDDDEEKPAKKAKATETPKKESAAAAKKETPKKDSAASTKKDTPKKEVAAPKKETTPKKAATPTKSKGKK